MTSYKIYILDKCSSHILTIKDIEAQRYFNNKRIVFRDYYVYLSMRHNKCLLEN